MNDWFKHAQLALFILNTSCHSAIGCNPTVLFHGREPIKPLDLRFNNTLMNDILRIVNRYRIRRCNEQEIF